MKIKLFTILFILSALFVMAPLAQASSLGDLVNEEFDIVQEGVTGSSTSQDLNLTIADIIQTILGFLGILFVVLILWSGFQWMTAGGNTETIPKARQSIINAVIGLVIILAAYSITYFIITEVYDATKR